MEFGVTVLSYLFSNTLTPLQLCNGTFDDVSEEICVKIIEGVHSFNITERSNSTLALLLSNKVDDPTVVQIHLFEQSASNQNAYVNRMHSPNRP